MKLSIWSSYYRDLKAEDAIERLLNNGITCCELSDEHGFELLERSDDVVATGKAFAAFIKERGFEIPQGHLWLRIKICSDETALEKLYRWIDMYEAIGIKYMVLHCDNMMESSLTREEKITKNVEKLRLVKDYVSGRDVTICLENLRPHLSADEDLIDKTVEDLLYLLDEIDSPNFAICLDTGHLNLTVKNHREFILKAGDRLKALHIADNEGVNDQHLMPYNCGTVDFVEVVKALREIGYDGLFNLEISGERRVPLELRDAKIPYIRYCYDYLLRQTDACCKE